MRDVARERDEQADRVLGRRDDVRLGRVRDDDPPPGRGVDVDVVDAHARAADHLQARPVGDHVRRHLGRGPDDQRVVVAEDLVERRVGVDVDVELRAQELHPGIRDRLADQYLHAATCPS